ncbi:MAG: 1,4-alpha-glucan branching protein GlgB [Christensenellales bacterium]
MQKNYDDYPKYLFHEGTNTEAYKLFCPKRAVENGERGWFFRVWAPKASKVSVVGDFNGWNVNASPMKNDGGGIWELFIKGLEVYDAYKYAVTSKTGKTVLKADPYGLHFETAPHTAAKLYDISGYKWKDADWMKEREKKNHYESPMNIYEVHLGSWKRHADGNVMSYRDLADELVSYVKKMNYTHVEFMPVTEYPYDGSWGYQVTGLFAPTSRYGTPHDFMYLVDRFHKAGIGVILDWVIAHFPKDEHGLSLFDGTPCYEYADPKKGEHYEWGTKVYDYGKPEVRSFLISAADFWAEYYHIDGIRVDAVASMLYLDYCRKPGEWIPNKFGGNYNLEAKEFLQQMNKALLTSHKGFITIAEESTAYPMITMPPESGGLGFNFKWNMGWMNDTLSYISTDPFFRKEIHNKLTFALTYAYSENYILPLSHDEVVHGKCSLINKMPGQYDDKFEGLKAYLGFMMTHPGKKLLFMGGEFAQFIEWRYDRGLDWLLLDYPRHRQMLEYTKELNALYRNTPALWSQDNMWEGFRWVSVDDNTQNVLSYLRYDKSGDYVLVIVNFSPVTRKRYLTGVPELTGYKCVFSSVAKKFGGTKTHYPVYKAEKKSMHGLPFAVSVNIPGNSFTVYKPENK